MKHLVQLNKLVFRLILVVEANYLYQVQKSVGNLIVRFRSLVVAYITLNGEITKAKMEMILLSDPTLKTNLGTNGTRKYYLLNKVIEEFIHNNKYEIKNETIRILSPNEFITKPSTTPIITKKKPHTPKRGHSLGDQAYKILLKCLDNPKTHPVTTKEFGAALELNGYTPTQIKNMIARGIGLAKKNPKLETYRDGKCVGVRFKVNSPPGPNAAKPPEPTPKPPEPTKDDKAIKELEQKAKELNGLRSTMNIEAKVVTGG